MKLINIFCTLIRKIDSLLELELIWEEFSSQPRIIDEKDEKKIKKGKMQEKEKSRDQ